MILLILDYISAASPHSCLLHHELLNFMLVAMSTQLCSEPSPGPKDVHPFLDAAMVQESAVVGSVVRRLLLNYIARPRIPYNNSVYPIFSDGSQPGVLQRVGSAAVSSSGEGSRSPLADNSLLVLLILIHYRKCIMVDDSIVNNGVENADPNTFIKENSYFSTTRTARH
ncbi:hypothetical protein QJS10_CPB18g01227 [Acorus calamus]|uniref:Dymeclin n=1 Tax=Acorus calamus TaxID=4465 RepID=A0AAV9CMX3_ACOCL|nr:hypothetical protein QJS10_CPB18g01227 [Acorus calamus]